MTETLVITESLPILFRAEKSGQFKGEVTAVFPTQPGSKHSDDFTVYAHIGQHSTGTREWYNRTRPAKQEEYASLLKELRARYHPVKLKVVHRITADMDRERLATAQK